MIPGVSFDDLHCFDDLGMILADKKIGPPEVQTRFVDVPGRNGPLDFTEALTGDVRYGSRPLTLTFVTNEYISKQGWEEFLIMVEDAIHGQRKEIMFDDGGYSYTGRCTINDFTTSWGKQKIVIDCTCDPFPIELDRFAFYSADDDSLNFYCGHIPATGDQYRHKTVTAVYTDVESTGSSNPPWYSLNGDIKTVNIHSSFEGARPTSCYRWFSGMENCTEINSLANLNTSNVTTMYYMFYNCSLVTELNVSHFDTSNVTTMTYMFSGCSAVTHLDVSGFDTSNVTTMSYMFSQCSSLAALNVSKFDTSKVTTFAFTFRSCSGVKSLDVSHFNTSNVTSLNGMFYACSGLTELDVSSFDTAKVINTESMLRSCSALTTIYSDDDMFVTTAIKSGSAMFTGCSSLVGGNGTTYSSSRVTYEYAHIDTRNNPGYFTGK